MSLRQRGRLVETLSSSMGHGGQNLETAVGALGRVLDEGTWREFETRDGRTVTPASFEEFVTTQPLRGLGVTVDLVKRVVRGNTPLEDTIDDLLRNPHGGDRSKSNNVTLAPRGNEKDKALRRLRTQRPDLHAEVLADNLTAHAAMVKAGFRRATVTIPIDDAASIARTLRAKATPEVLAELQKLLARESPE